MTNPLQRFLRSEALWRMSGITYLSAIRATQGHWSSVANYVERCQRQMQTLSEYVDPGTLVIELGSGLGGNLVSISRRVSSCVGIDINPLYVRLAKRLAARRGVTNTKFISYDGSQLPPAISDFQLALSIGVFERISRDRVTFLVSQLCRSAKPGARLLLYFLNERARGSRFTRLLGDSAYTFWNEPQVHQLAEATRFRIEAILPWGEGGVRFDSPTAPASLVVARIPFVEEDVGVKIETSVRRRSTS